MMSDQVKLPLSQENILVNELKNLLKDMYSNNVGVQQNQHFVSFSLKKILPNNKEIKIIWVKIVFSVEKFDFCKTIVETDYLGHTFYLDLILISLFYKALGFFLYVILLLHTPQ